MDGFNLIVNDNVPPNKMLVFDQNNLEKMLRNMILDNQTLTVQPMILIAHPDNHKTTQRALAGWPAAPIRSRRGARGRAYSLKWRYVNA